MKRKTVKDLDALMGAKRTVQAKAHRKMEKMLIGEVRKQLGHTQVTVAKKMGISQSALSQVESQSDMQLSTLQRLVRAMGGEVNVVMRFGKREIVLTH